MEPTEFSPRVSAVQFQLHILTAFRKFDWLMLYNQWYVQQKGKTILNSRLTLNPTKWSNALK